MKIIAALLMFIVGAYSAFAAHDETIHYMKSANFSIQHQQWSQAEKELLKVIELDFKHVRARYLLGKLAEERGDLRLAKKRYKMTLFVEKKYRLALIGWGRVAEKLNSSDMLVPYQRILKLEPNKISWHLKIAQYYMEKGSIKTKRHLKNALKINPDNRPALEMMVKYHKKYAFPSHAKPFQKRLDKLSSSFAKSIQEQKAPLLNAKASVLINPVQVILIKTDQPVVKQIESDVSRYMDVAQAHLKAQEWRQAEEYLLKVIKLDFKHLHARYLLGKAAEERGKLRLAVKRYKMVLVIDKKHLSALLAWGRVAEKLNSNDVLVAYLRAIKVEPDNALWHFKVAQYYMKHKPLKSKRYLNNVLKIVPDHRQALELMIEYHNKHTLVAHTDIYQRRLDALSPSLATAFSQTTQAKEFVQAVNKIQIKSPVQDVDQLPEQNVLTLSTLFSSSKLWVQQLTFPPKILLNNGLYQSKPLVDNHAPVKVNSPSSVKQINKVVSALPPQDKTMNIQKGVERSKRLADDLFTSDKSEFDVRGHQHYEQVLKHGDAQEQFMLGLIYHEGGGGRKHELRAVSLLKKAAIQGLGKAQFTLGLMLYQGNGIKKSEMAAIRWFKGAVNNGVIDAQYALGLLYATSDRYKNDRIAVKWWKSAALQNHAQAQHNLAVMYLEGRGVEKSRTRAIRWLQQEAKHDKLEIFPNTDQLYSEGEYNVMGRTTLND